MKFVIFSDIHGNAIALKECIKKIKKMNIDAIIWCGDYVTDFPGSHEVIQIIKEYATRIKSYIISGNREQNIIDYDKDKKCNIKQKGNLEYTHKLLDENDAEWIKYLPDSINIELDNGEFIYVSHKCTYEKIDKCKYKIFGHSHRQCNFIRDGVKYINPGAVGISVDGNVGAEFAILEITEDCEKLEEYIVKYNDRKNSFERLPPKRLMPPSIQIKSQDDIMMLGTLLQYDLLWQYSKSKNTNKFDKFKRIIENYKNAMENFPVSDYRIRYQIEKIGAIGFITELMNRNKICSLEKLGLPKDMKFGVELEFVGIESPQLEYIKNHLKYQYDLDFLKGFNITFDLSVRGKSQKFYMGKMGTEVTSPILEDNWESWKKLKEVCLFIQAIGGKVNATCGGHIHIGDNVLGTDKKAWETFIEVWNEAEPLIFMISNRRGERTRKDAKRFAYMNSEYKKDIDWENLCIESEEDIKK